jgi:hypothetical protein
MPPPFSCSAATSEVDALQGICRCSIPDAKTSHGMDGGGVLLPVSLLAPYRDYWVDPRRASGRDIGRQRGHDPQKQRPDEQGCGIGRRDAIEQTGDEPSQKQSDGDPDANASGDEAGIVGKVHGMEAAPAADQGLRQGGEEYPAAPLTPRALPRASHATERLDGRCDRQDKLPRARLTVLRPADGHRQREETVAKSGAATALRQQFGGLEGPCANLVKRGRVRRPGVESAGPQEVLCHPAIAESF